LFGGRLTLTADGFDSIEWKKTLRARLEGDLVNSNVLFLQDFEKPLRSAFMGTELKDYSMKDLFVGSCGIDQAQAQIDAQVLPAEVHLDKLNIWSQNSNRVELSGVQVAGGELNLSGKFLPNTRCLKGDLRTCLRDLKGSSFLSIKSVGPLSGMETSLYNLPKLKDLRSCIEGKISARVQDDLLKESVIKKKL
jgi:hypothetical protein